VCHSEGTSPKGCITETSRAEVSLVEVPLVPSPARKGVVIPNAKRRNLLFAGSGHTAGDSRFLTANDAVRNDNFFSGPAQKKSTG
jgi:hypothetical protein